MGGNGTFALGRVVDYNWKTVSKIEGVKVLEPISGGHKLPEEAHSSRMYILQYPKDGNFAMLRIYDSRHRIRLEIANHREPALDKHAPTLLHYHVYTYPNGSSKFKRSNAKRLSERARRKFGKFMKGV